MMLHAINCDLGHRQYQAVKCMPADINEADLSKYKLPGGAPCHPELKYQKHANTL